MSTARFVLSPQAVSDLVEIWQYIYDHGSEEAADRIEATILEKVKLLTKRPRAGHARKDLTDLPVKFFPVYSYLIVYRAETKPLQLVSIIHGRRDVERLLKANV